MKACALYICAGPSSDGSGAGDDAAEHKQVEERASAGADGMDDRALGEVTVLNKHQMALFGLVPWVLVPVVPVMVLWHAYVVAVSELPQALSGLDDNVIIMIQASCYLIFVGTLWQVLRGFQPLQLGLFPLSWASWQQWVQPMAVACALFASCIHIIASKCIGSVGPLRLTLLLLLRHQNLTSTVVRIVSAAVIAPFAEEVLYRGFLQQSLYKFMPTWCAVLVSAAGFSLVHASKHYKFPIAQFLLGLVLGWLYAVTGNLLPPVLMHGLWNAALFLVTTTQMMILGSIASLTKA
jgi:membrane protease YdiL (CAAX protease family)